ncbi:peptidase [Streptomyces sp. NPDC019539]|uniref:peptidase n=1 Tax=Streptomyces sp. NPDC019539 TaxID=3365063 RepID=UPI00378A5BE9
MTALTALLGGPATAHAVDSPDTDQGLIGVRLVDAPVVRRADPRALSYIVDHLPPGTTIERRVEVSNKSSQRREFELYSAEAKIKDNHFVFSPGHTANELTTWVTTAPARLTLEPGEKARAVVKAAIPRAAAKGERYAVFWAQTSAPVDRTHNVAAVSRVGIRMYLSVGPGGEPPSSFRISEFSVHRTEAGAPVVTAKVRNTGGRALDLKGKVDLSGGPGGLRAGPFYVRPGTTLLPGAVGTVAADLDPRLPDGPWAGKLSLESGTVKQHVSGTITFPPKGATWLAGLGTSPHASTGYLGGAVLTGIACLAALRTRRRRRLRAAK